MSSSELRYRVAIRPLSEEDGGGWLAEIPELDGCMTDGETPEEALANLAEAKAAWLETAKKLGWTIPCPAPVQEDFSGKFTLRLPKSLHARLSRIASEEGVSLNQYLLYLITSNHGLPVPREVTRGKDQSDHAMVIEVLSRMLERMGPDDQAVSVNWGDDWIIAPRFPSRSTASRSSHNRLEQFIVEVTK